MLRAPLSIGRARLRTQAVVPHPLPNLGVKCNRPLEDDPLTPASANECQRSVFVAADGYTFLPMLMSYPAGMGLWAWCLLSYGVYFISILVKLKETDSVGLSPDELME